MSSTVNWENNAFASSHVGFGDYHILKHCVYDVSALLHLGQIEGKSLLDIGCGEGHFCRLVKSKGASRVLGVDVSPVMIEISKEHDVGGLCEYKMNNIYRMGKIDEFDYVTANLVIPYANTIENLSKMCRAFYNNLTPGGRFVGLAVNCLEGDYNWGKSLEKYGIELFNRISKIDKLTTCELILRLNPQDGKQFEAVTHYFEPQVYESAFLKSGFKSFCFKPVIADKEILGNYPQDFLDDYFKHPVHLCYVATK